MTGWSWWKLRFGAEESGQNFAWHSFRSSEPAREPFLRAPGSVIGLIGLLVAAHLARVFAPATTSEWILNTYALNPARYSAQFLQSHHVDPGTLFERVARSSPTCCCTPTRCISR